MNVYKVTKKNRDATAAFMAFARADWWPCVEDAKRQIAGRDAWMLGKDDTSPIGFASIIDMPDYKTVEIDVIGGVHDDAFHVDETLDPLLVHMEDFARRRGRANIRFIITSAATTLDGSDVPHPAKAIEDFRSEREDVVWLMSRGFSVHGILPHVYGKGKHGIVLLKSLTP